LGDLQGTRVAKNILNIRDGKQPEECTDTEMSVTLLPLGKN